MMLEQPTADRLRAFRLSAMLEELDRQATHPEMAALSFADRLSLLVDAE